MDSMCRELFSGGDAEMCAFYYKTSQRCQYRNAGNRILAVPLAAATLLLVSSTLAPANASSARECYEKGVADGKWEGQREGMEEGLRKRSQEDYSNDPCGTQFFDDYMRGRNAGQSRGEEEGFAEGRRRRQERERQHWDDIEDELNDK